MGRESKSRDRGEPIRNRQAGSRTSGYAPPPRHPRPPAPSKPKPKEPKK
jgi:hypothetical protein